MIEMIVAIYVFVIQAGLGHAVIDAREARCLSLTIYWEARGGGRDTMLAVGWVVLNRRNSSHFPNTICSVVHDGGENPPCQFSYWCDGQADVPEHEKSWTFAQKIAAQLLTNPPSDPTQGAIFYHSIDVSPAWTREHKRTAQIGRHVFYR